MVIAGSSDELFSSSLNCCLLWLCRRTPSFSIFCPVISVMDEGSKAFAEKKTKIMQSLNQPSEEYSDLSPKGSVDEGIRRLIDLINTNDGGERSLGKGLGGRWLYVAHEPVHIDNAQISLREIFSLPEQSEIRSNASYSGRRLVTFQFEPMVTLSPAPDVAICRARLRRA